MIERRNALAAALAMLLTKEAGHCISMPMSCVEGVAGFDLRTWCRKHNIWHSISNRTVTFKLNEPK
ncbi:hypothetical protein UFOVP1329_34 [uncultured Caudovirales phage]|uniref:Uncharacterized protein n=1 Tax=uncultured Caudovirales phage TaxID=2100421 RepID=A0A6J5QVE6_9CAUD|nr:hypothetical protein UFOVP1150_15 [uncultured Caudovirales phage]CAB4199278.1 hypothetical protein UFOVP1329_34 [uncultured Caudovirales phage]CAB4218190.1 hypothetical protein UFOVP1595_2 [uncultured Caudovirales phage]